jgi:hypothetical protein
MASEVTVIDADGHILEPPDLWERYLEPKYRERAIRIVVGQDGYEYLEIDRKISRLCRRGQLATLGGMGKKVADAARMRECRTPRPSCRCRPDRATRSDGQGGALYPRSA